MMLSIYVRGCAVATLEAVGEFKSILTYQASAAPDNFVCNMLCRALGRHKKYR